MEEYFFGPNAIHERRIQILTFANNHFQGFGPGTLEEFKKLWGWRVKDESKIGRTETLFPI
jgi:hypothetical protein